MTDTLGQPFNVRLSDQDREKLRRLAAENDRTMQQEIRRAIRLYLEGAKNND